MRDSSPVKSASYGKSHPSCSLYWYSCRDTVYVHHASLTVTRACLGHITNAMRPMTAIATGIHKYGTRLNQSRPLSLESSSIEAGSTSSSSTFGLVVSPHCGQVT